MVEGVSDCAVAFREAHDPNFLEPSGTRLAQPLSNSRADPRVARIGRKIARECELSWIARKLGQPMNA